jgi:hypothetical protein
MAFKETRVFSLRRRGHGIWGDAAMAFGETRPWHLRRRPMAFEETPHGI